MAVRYLFVKPSSKKRVRVSTFTRGVDYSVDEAVMTPSVARDCYNFDFSGGALKDGYGLESSGLFDGISVRTVFRFRRFDADKNMRDDRVLAVGTDGRLYESLGGSVRTVGTLTFSGTPLFFNYRLYGEDVAFICSQDGGTFVYDGKSEPYRVDGAPHITSLALHGERLFVTVDGEKSSVWFSDDLDPTNWDASLSGGGFIQLLDERGSLNRVVSYLGYLYVFREFGISRISAVGAQTDFSVSNLFVSGGRIYPDTVTLCGDLITFLGEDGLYAFDGISGKRLLKNLDGLIESPETAVSAYASGKLYLAFRRGTDGETVGCESGEYRNNAMLTLDLGTGAYSLSRGMDIRALCTVDGEMLAVDGLGRTARVTKCGSLFSQPLKKCWKMPLTDLGTPDKKRVRELAIFSAQPLSVTVFSDERSKTLSFGGGFGKKRVPISGERIGMLIRSDGVGVSISRPTLTLSV